MNIWSPKNANSVSSFRRKMEVYLDISIMYILWYSKSVSCHITERLVQQQITWKASPNSTEPNVQRSKRLCWHFTPIANALLKPLIFVKHNLESTKGVQGEKSSKEMASSRNLVSTWNTSKICKKFKAGYKVMSLCKVWWMESLIGQYKYSMCKYQMGQDQVPVWVIDLCQHATTVTYFLWKPLGII